MPRSVVSVLALAGLPSCWPWSTPPVEPRVSAEAERLAPVARRLGLALGRPGFRVWFDSALRASPAGVVRIGRLASRGDPLFASIPVARHWNRWTDAPGTPVLVAVGREGVPLAFDQRGGRHVLDPGRPPETPVVLISPGGLPRCPGRWNCLPSTRITLAPDRGPAPPRRESGHHTPGTENVP